MVAGQAMAAQLAMTRLGATAAAPGAALVVPALKAAYMLATHPASGARAERRTILLAASLAHPVGTVPGGRKAFAGERSAARRRIGYACGITENRFDGDT
jgi:hypothetical protein